MTTCPCPPGMKYHAGNCPIYPGAAQGEERMGMRIEARVEVHQDHAEYTVILECDDRLPAEDIVPWTETYRVLAQDFAPPSRPLPEMQRRRTTVVNT